MSKIFPQLPTHREIGKWANVPTEKWDNWHWQLQNAVRTLEELRNLLDVIPGWSEEEAKIISEITRSFEMKLTPHTVLNIFRAIKIGDHSGSKALLATFIPSINEQVRLEGSVDSIGEEIECCKPAPLVTNFYKSRVLLFVTNMCPSYCRFCFRRRKIGDHVSEEVERANTKALRQAMEYIRGNKAIREVIVSGGDPLTLNDDRILSLLKDLKAIEHIKVLRIDTKVLTTLPQRITPELVKGLKKLKPIYIVGNFLHSVELTPESLAAASLLIDAGIPVFSHTALLRGINDDAEIIAELMWNLYVNRIIPYYLIQFIPTKWTEHFRVPIQKGLEIMEYLHGRLSGIANPTYIVYLPDGGGKVPLLPNYLLERTAEGYYFKNFEGRKILYKEQIEL
jgi:lysine 2,3-aminomutase